MRSNIVSLNKHSSKRNKKHARNRLGRLATSSMQFEMLEQRHLFAADLIKDINTNQDSSSLQGLMQGFHSSSNVGYYSYSTPETGYEVWRTDGTPAGTQLLKDIEPGAGDSFPNTFFEFQGNTYFIAAVNGSNLLWRTDGTEVGTYPISTIFSNQVLALGDHIYYTNSQPETGVELWRSDGTIQGSSLLLDFSAGEISTNPAFMFEANDKLVLAGIVNDVQRLLVYDPTSAVPAFDVLSSQFTPVTRETAIGSSFLIGGIDSNNGFGYWMVDGIPSNTAPVVLAGTSQKLLGVTNGFAIFQYDIGENRQIVSYAPIGSVSILANIPNTTFLYPFQDMIDGTLAISIQNALTNEYQVILTDGFSATSVSLPSGIAIPFGDSPAFNGSWYFNADLNGFRNLWRLSEATSAVEQFDFDAVLFSNIKVTTQGLYWTVDSGAESHLKFSPDGIGRLTSPSTFAPGYGVANFGEVNGHVVFAGIGTDGLALRTLTGPNDTPISPLRAGATIGSLAQFFGTTATFQGRRYFFADSDNDTYFELWRTDGTEAGTILITIENFGFNTRLIATDSRVYVVSGTSSTVTLHGVNDAPGDHGTQFLGTLLTDSPAPNFLVSLGNKLVYSDDKNQLWVSDGTFGGKQLIKVFNSGIDAQPHSPVVVGNTVYFTARDELSREQLWKSDGTFEGTQVVATGDGASWYHVATDGKSIYWASSSPDYSIWRSDDGLQTRTKIADTTVHGLAARDGFLYYSRILNNGQVGIYRTDGSLGPITQIGLMDNGLQFLPQFRDFGDRILVEGIVEGNLVIQSDVGEGMLVTDPTLSVFDSLNITDLYGETIGPGRFAQYGLEMGSIPFATRLDLSNRVIEENAAPGVVASVSLLGFISPALPVYSLVLGEGSDDNSLFGLTSDGQLYSMVPFNAEQSSTRSIRIRAANLAGTIIEQSVTIFIRDVLDSVESIDLSKNVVLENQPAGTFIGSLSSIAPPNTPISYSIVSINGMTTNLPLAIVGTSLFTTQSFDFETTRAYDIVIKATIPTDEVQSTLQVHIANVNENATQVITLSSDDLLENNSGFIGNLSIPSLGAGWTYSLVSGPGDYDNQDFAIDQDQLIALNSFDYELIDNLSVRVRAQRGAETIESFLTIDLLPVDEFPIIAIDGYLLLENTPVGTALPLTVVDLDRGGNYLFEGEYIDGGTGEVVAKVMGSSLVVMQPINFEQLLDLGAFLSVTDVSSGNRLALQGGGVSATIFFLGNVNDAPELGTPLYDQDVQAGTNSDFSLPLDTFTDEDAGDTLAYSATWNGGSLPSWLVFNPNTLQFSSSATAADVGVYSISVLATDLLGSVASSTFTLSVLSQQEIVVQGTSGNDAILITPINPALNQWSIRRNGAIVFSGDIMNQRAVRISGGTGSDQLIVQGTNDADSIAFNNSQINLGLARIFLEDIEDPRIQGRLGNDTFRALGDVSGPFSIDGGTGQDRLQSDSLFNSWQINSNGGGQLNGVTFTGLENLQGGTGVDSFTIGASGSVLGQLDGGKGINSLTYLPRTGAISLRTTSLYPISVTGTGAAQILNVNSIENQSLSTSTFTGPGPEVRPDANIHWRINGASIRLTDSFTFTGFQRLTGSAASDVFSFFNVDTSYTIDGLAGLDSVGYSIFTPVTVNLNAKTGTAMTRFANIESFNAGGNQSTAIGLNANTTWTLDPNIASITNSQNVTFKNFLQIVGGSRNDVFNVPYNSDLIPALDGGLGVDTLRSQDHPAFLSHNQWSLTGAGAGTLNTLTFALMENLIGGSWMDDFTFSGVTPGAIWFESISGIPGNQTTIQYDASVSGATVNLDTSVATGVRRFANVGSFIAASETDRLIGRRTGARWTINGDGGFSFDGTTLFQGFDVIVGGIGNDTFQIVGSDFELPKRIEGGSGVNWIDLSQFNLPASINLQLGTASMLSQGILGIQNAIGTLFDDILIGNTLNNLLSGLGGNDEIRGGAGNDTLLGGSGDDQLFGEAGRDILLGGTGADTLNGGAGDDLIISGINSQLVFEGQFGLVAINQVAIQAILAEWASARSFQLRIAQLRAGVAGGTVKLDSTTISGDADVDQLFGELNDDWFWSSPDDLITDLNPLREVVN